MSSYTRKRTPARKPRNRRTSPAKKGMPAWLLFASGLAVGIFLMLIKNVGGQKEMPVADTLEESTPVVDSRPRPRFDFYDLLPESRVPVGADRPEPPPTPAPVLQESRPQPPTTRPEPAIVTAPPAPTPAPVATRPEQPAPSPSSPAAEPNHTATTPAPAATSNRLLLQAGSFRSQGDADNLRAQLLLMGLSASIETFNPNQGETWHRVIVGPYDNHQSMDSARSQLTANGIDTLMLRR